MPDGAAAVSTGRCLCGAVSWAFDGAPLWTAHCHCESCRRATGAGVATFLSIPRDRFRWGGATPRSYASSPGVTRRFCPTCGAPVSYEWEGAPDEVHVYAGHLDDPTRCAPERHDFREEAVPWLHLADALPNEGEGR